ncbi:hypothetical protein Mapa_014017 [Marchantia paleacea]|nr:hypothetical protein Mapa_014017 [Marchantia paleacea]
MMGFLTKKAREVKRENKAKGLSNINDRRWFCLPFSGGRRPDSRIWHDPSLCSSPHLRPIRQFSLAELKRATQQFLESNILDDDNENFTIYRAQLPHIDYFRVRRTKLENRGTLEQFLSELKVLSSVHHRNLVSLVGFCKEGGEHLLVYEHVEGTLSNYLHDHHGNPLSWTKRLDIALGVARGLSHLHEHADPPIVHRNIKSSSILLNYKLVPKVSEVGLSRQMTEGTEQTRQTQGYLPPEHYETGTCSDKSDVYAYGVVLLEILTGMKSFDRERFQHHQKVLLVDLVRSAYYERGWRSVRRKVDPHIRIEAHNSTQKRFLEIAMDCLEEDRAKRPTMRDVADRLEELVQRRPSYP